MNDLYTRVSRKASKQAGRISTKQLRELGVDKSRAHRWCQDGRLTREHEGVYAVGPQGCASPRCRGRFSTWRQG